MRKKIILSISLLFLILMIFKNKFSKIDNRNQNIEFKGKLTKAIAG